jgi:hypothetical protein
LDRKAEEAVERDCDNATKLLKFQLCEITFDTVISVAYLKAIQICDLNSELTHFRRGKVKKVKLSLCLEDEGGGGIAPQFLTSALDGGE